jgi:hypothetical protein
MFDNGRMCEENGREGVASADGGADVLADGVRWSNVGFGSRAAFAATGIATGLPQIADDLLQ